MTTDFVPVFLTGGEVKVTFTSSTSFNISWNRGVMDGDGERHGVMDGDADGGCYSVEWSAAGLRPTNMSFYEEASYKVVPVKGVYEIHI